MSPTSRSAPRPSVWAWVAFVTACGVVVSAMLFNPTATGTPTVVGPVAAPPTAAAVRTGPVRPLANDCRAGTVHLTFDDGPGAHTAQLLDELSALHMQAVFFVMAERVAGREADIRREVALGDVVGNHTYRHFNLVTGEDLAGVARKPWTDTQVRFELQKANDIIQAAGAPRPTLYRPPYGSVDPQVDAVARTLGLRLVMPWSDTQDTFDDGHDTDPGATPASVADHVLSGLKPGTIITLHDGDQDAALISATALQTIVDGLNKRHYCVSPRLPADATGGALTSGTASTGRDE
ncbi:hypothetical protein GCM10009836_65110 [Pseudonocardia ailaonensis]|uniref:NodB homology domain-containing protein n=1 Tax=Pseudonocardia ailaonensis TaxID=367279 RepID=A0ABN2NM09_9PSEU